MSLVWTMIAYFLYAEIALVLLMVLPILNVCRWNRLIKSKFMQMMSKQAHVYFYFVMCVLVLFLLDSIREMRKYSTQSTPTEAHLNVELQHSLRLFRAQRNFYISGFAIFLVLVIRRLITLISYQAYLLAQSEASLKQAQSASATLKKMMGDGKSEGGDKSDNPPSEGGKSKVDELEKRIRDLVDELSCEKKDKAALKSQAESLNREYDRLTNEYSKLERKLAQVPNSPKAAGGKMDNKDE